MDIKSEYQQCVQLQSIHRVRWAIIIIACIISFTTVSLFWAFMPMPEEELILGAPTPEEELIVSVDDPGEIIFSINFDGGLTFYRNNVIIGRLWHDEQDVFHFDGDADASAHVFFRVLESTYQGGEL